MEATNIIPVTIEDEMRGSYMDYAMSVIIGRALPDVRDGLKPVHRRILYAMFREGLASNKKFSKCAGVVGEVLKHYHPHGDSAVYDALVRMAQPWNLRYPFIDGQGNFGSVDGDSAAAYRYTECRLKAIAEFTLADIDKDTVDFVPNFDESVNEPVVLPSRVPTLLVNGAEGIAVGMASRIPPHNLREVIAGTIKLIKNPDASIDELMEAIPGPDFPTSGVIYGAEPLRSIYQTGRGLFQIRASVRYETINTGKRETEAIVVDEIPYQVNKAKLVEKIAELVNHKKIVGISRLRDESDRTGMRIVIELKRDAVADVVLSQLYKLTNMQRTFGVIMLAIVDGRPQVLPLNSLLLNFIDHRRTTIIRRSRFELNKALARQHVLEGFRIALDNIDEIIRVIKASESTQEAKLALQEKFPLSEVQAQHILDMPLRRLTGLERRAIEKELEELAVLIAALQKILSNPAEVDRVAIEELEEVSEKFGDDRRTRIEAQGDEIDLEDLIAEEDMMVTISHRGYVKRCSPSIYRAQHRGGVGVQGTKKLAEDAEDFVSEIFVASTHAYLLVFTSKGKLYWLKVHQLPDVARTARGRAIVNMLRLSEGEEISAILPVRRFEEGHYVVIVTRLGKIKRVDLMAFANVRKGGIKAIVLDEGDEVLGAQLTDGDRDCIISTRFGMSIRFDEAKTRATGRSAKGVRAISLEGNDEVVNLVTAAAVSSDGGDEADSEEAFLLTVCENGHGKRTKISEYRQQNRAGKGLIDIKTNDRNGNVVAACRVQSEDEVMLITTGGKVIRTPVDTISVVSRNTMGVRLIKLSEGENVAAVARLADAKEPTNGDEPVEDDS